MRVLSFVLQKKWMVNTHTSVNVEDVLLSTRWRLIHVTLFTLLNLKMASIKK